MQANFILIMSLLVNHNFHKWHKNVKSAAPTQFSRYNQNILSGEWYWRSEEESEETLCETEGDNRKEELGRILASLQSAWQEVWLTELKSA